MTLRIRRTWRTWRTVRLNFSAGLVALLAGCANLGYYVQAVDGHLDIRDRTRSINAIIADPDANQALSQVGAIIKARS
ncbi:MAG: hypothetical protein L0H15_11380, partial [Nitrosospira sp.]|nr:hypothetical protein [Nitrosospira sp.]